MLSKLWGKKVFRFLCVGVINTATDLTILNTLVFAFKFPPLIANIISATISIIVSYFLNHKLVFQSQQPHHWSHFIRFFLVTGSGILVVQTTVIYALIHALHPDIHWLNGVLLNDFHFRHIKADFVNLNIAKLVAVVVAMGWNYIMYHLVVFTRHEEDAEDIAPTTPV